MLQYSKTLTGQFSIVRLHCSTASGQVDQASVAKNVRGSRRQPTAAWLITASDLPNETLCGSKPLQILGP